jgi:hypothetical protein
MDAKRNAQLEASEVLQTFFVCNGITTSGNSPGSIAQFDDATCDSTAIADSATGVYVDGDNGSDASGNGAIATPFKTVGAAVASAVATSSKTRVYLSPANYAERVTAAVGGRSVFIEGGWTPASSSWTRDCAADARIKTRLSGIAIQGGSTVGLRSMTIAPPVSDLAALTTTGANIVLRHVDLSAPDGSEGLNGTNGGNGAAVSGTTQACSTGFNGSSGASGLDGVWQFNGVAFTRGDGGNGGSAGSGLSGRLGESNFPSCTETTCSAPIFCSTQFTFKENLTANGGQCGRGGVGGAFGTRGTGGGASVGIVLANAQGSLIDSHVFVGAGGRGGSGGTGGTGSNGSAGASGSTTSVTCAKDSCANGVCASVGSSETVSATGEAGTAGGRGGNGGRGGHGAGGPSIAIARIGSSSSNLDATSSLTIGTGGQNGGTNRGNAIAREVYDQP